MKPKRKLPVLYQFILVSCRNFADSSSQIVIELIRLFATVVEQYGSEIDRKLWDLILISLCSWSTRMNQTKTNYYKSTSVSAFIVAVTDLFVKINIFMDTLRATTTSLNSSSTANASTTRASSAGTSSTMTTSTADSSAIVSSATSVGQDFLDEWDNLLGENVNLDVINVFYHLSGECSTLNIKLLTFERLTLFVCFGKCLTQVNYKNIFKRKDEGASSSSSSVPNWSKLLKRCCQLLTNKDVVLQIWSYHVLLGKLLDFNV